MSFGNFKAPKNDSKYYWTRHSIGKMMQYGLSAQRVTRVIRSFERIETGVAKDTVAVMQPNAIKVDKEGKKKWSQEIWVMYQRRRAPISKSQETRKQTPACRQAGIQNSKLEKKEENKLNLMMEISGKNQLKIISVWRYPGISPKNNPIPSDILDEVEELL